MKAIEIINASARYQFKLDPSGWFRLDRLPCPCPEEMGLTGCIESQADRVELATFLRCVADTLSTPKRSRS